MPIEVIHFNPKRRPAGLLNRWRPKRPLNNFGDLIGPPLVRRIEQEYGLNQPSEHRRLLAVGSIMRLSNPGDVVWGSGVNGKTLHPGAAPALDVRAVRGPRTREFLAAAGTEVPEIYGDPALLWSRYWPRDYYLANAKTRPVTIVPNHNDMRGLSDDRVLSPLGQAHDVIRQLAASEFVCGSSLHGIVIAESFGIPARLVVSDHEALFKYEDYYAGTGRSNFDVASSVEEAIAMGGERPPVFDADALINAFPTDLYVSE